ncbi:fimbria/pilus outer membrane usher protein [Edaphovirga cremea]|uniref:fimbria/pilus outer membrane usher protein n=1 Tax=Edaphovirga cremea TaxID=2267246 RepID=UPI000DEFDAD9|nr:fimbria/pilus outer membrane usher protein [Edaphovirga cremea]
MPPFKLSRLTLLILVASLPVELLADDTLTQDTAPSTAGAMDDEQGAQFDPIFLSQTQRGNIDLTRFEHGASVLPGIYKADISINGLLVGNENIQFTEQPDRSVQPCLTRDMLKSIDFNYDKLPASFNDALKSDQTCFPLKALLPQAQSEFDSGLQQLNITVPQLYMNNTARGYVSPALWDKGVPAGILGYSINGNTQRSRGQTSNSAFGGINSGLNVGGWYLRHNGSYNWQENYGGHYESLNTYVQRDIPAIMGRVIVGESNTQGQVFDTLAYRGVELLSEDRMLPSSQRGYAPTVRGIARTNARVTIRQNGRVINEVNVPPGAFEINDLYPTGYGGTLDVTVTEADGSIQNFSVPFASVANLLRPGSHRYNLVAGKLRDNNLSKDYALYQATYQRGMSNLITSYGGLQASQNYYSLQLGSALSTAIGAFSADVSHARTHLNSEPTNRMSGESYQLGYSKFLPETKSSLSIAAYRFSTSGYMDFQTAVRAQDAEANGLSIKNIRRPKSRFNVTVSQGLPDRWGQIYVTGYTQDYWNYGNSDLQYQMGYSNSYKMVTYNLTAGRSRNGVGAMENNVLFSLSVPLGRQDRSNVPQLTASLNRNSNGQSGQQVGVSGSAGEDSRYSYGVTGTNYNQGIGSSMALNGQFRSPVSNMTAGYSTGRNYQSASAGLSGTLLAYQGGLVMTPYSGDTFAIVEAKGAAGAKVGNYSGLRVDRWGHAAVPYLNPYELNEIIIDPKGLPYDVELQSTSQKVAPYAGAVVHLKYNTQQGYPLLITTTLSDGGPVPFGASVFDSKGNNVGTVGQMGQIYARVENERDQLSVKWGQDGAQQCSVSYLMPPQPKGKRMESLMRFASVCQG